MATNKAGAKKVRAAVKRNVTKKLGRPSDYTEKLALVICTQLADGNSLVSICREPEMPHRATVFRWLQDREDFRDMYVRAREAQADKLAEETIEIADEEVTMVRRSKHTYGAKPKDDADENDIEVVFDSAAVARNRLRVDARKWMAAKLAPKKYGEKVQLGGAEDLPPMRTVHDMPTEALLAIAAQAKAG